MVGGGASDYTDEADVDVASDAAEAALMVAHAASSAASAARRVLREASRTARLMRELASRTEAKVAEAEAHVADTVDVSECLCEEEGIRAYDAAGISDSVPRLVVDGFGFFK